MYFWLILVQVCLHEPVAAVARGLFYIKMSGGGEGGREALVLLFLSLSRPSHLYLSHSVIEWDLCCWLYEYKTRLLQWGVKAIYSTQILSSGIYGDTGRSFFVLLSCFMFAVLGRLHVHRKKTMLCKSCTALEDYFETWHEQRGI